MKKKIIAGLAALTCLTGALAISSPSVFAAEVSDETLVVSEDVTTTNYFRTVSQDLIDQGAFEYGGLSYTATSSGYLTATAVANPEEVTELILYYQFGRSTVTYSSLDLSGYTNLENVIVAGTNMNYAQTLLSSLPSGVNLYCGCACNFGDALKTMPFTNIYLYYLYSPTLNSFSDSDFKDYLAYSNVEHIYYNSFIATNKFASVNTFNEAAYVNKNGDTLQMEAFNDWTYPEYVFYPFQSWDSASPVFEAEGTWSCTTNSAVTGMNSFMFWADSIDERVVDISVPTLDTFYSIPSYREFGTIYMPRNESYDFLSIMADELVIRAYGSDSLNLSNLMYIKNLRFVKGASSFSVSSSLDENSLLEKIYIPNEYADKFTAITEDETLSQYVEYYDLETYELPTYNSYLSEDGNTYKTSVTTYSIDELENAKATLQAVGLETPTGTIINEVMDYYEFPIKDYSNETPSYTVRAFDTIVLPKNMDATKVLEAFEFLVVLNHGYMCDSTGASIVADTTNYTVGYNATLPLTITLPDNTIITQDVTVRVMTTEDDKAYILDGNDVYIITQDSTENITLASLMSTIMEYYMMETSVEYDASPLINNEYSYLAGNTYTATLTSGKAKIVTTDVELVEVTSDDTTNDNTGEDDTTNEEESDVVVKEITTIYTPKTVDGSRFMSVMRDFLVTVDGEAYNDYGFAIGTNSGRTNLEDYEFYAWATIEDYEYERQIDVKIIDFDYDMGFVIFEDGDIAVIFNYNNNYTNAQIEEAIKAFLTTQNLNADTLVMPTENIDSTETYKASYDNGDIYIVNSGVNVNYSSSTQAVDQSALKEGFKALNRVIYTNNFTMENAMRALGKNILLKDGKLYTEDFTIEYTTKENSKYVEVIFKSGETELLKDTFYFDEVESEYEYIFARALEFDNGYLIMDKHSKAPDYDINDVMLDIIPRFRGLMSPFATDVVVDFTKEFTTDIDGIYHVGNGSYYSYEYDVEITNLKSAIRTNEVVVDGNGPAGESVSDKLNDAFDDFKTRFEENKAFKAATIALGSITGILLIWGIWAIIRKLFKWLKR